VITPNDIEVFDYEIYFHDAPEQITMARFAIIPTEEISEYVMERISSGDAMWENFDHKIFFYLDTYLADYDFEDYKNPNNNGDFVIVS